MEKLNIELERVRGLVDFDPAIANRELERIIELEKYLLNTGTYSIEERFEMQKSVHHLNMLRIAVKQCIKT